MIRILSLAALALLSLPALAAPPPPEPISPSEAVRMADAARPNVGQKGRFAMQVAQTGKVGGALFLDSEPDYRAPDDLSFRLSPNVVAVLAKRYGAPPEVYLRGKRVVVDGYVRREAIVNVDRHFSNHVLGPNRWQHIVPSLFERQIVAVE